MQVPREASEFACQCFANKDLYHTCLLLYVDTPLILPKMYLMWLTLTERLATKNRTSNLISQQLRISS